MTRELGQLGQESQDRRAGTGTPEKTDRIGNMTARTGQLRQYNWDKTTLVVEIGHLGQDNGSPRQNNWDRTVGTRQPVQLVMTGQPGQVSLERTELKDCQDMAVASGEQWTRLPGQGRWNRTARTG